ncbi:MAG: hypothetical protein Q9174_004590 [Haloplaca sp. 1 TL-2023]
MDDQDAQSQLRLAEAKLHAVLEDKDHFASKLEPTFQEYRSRCEDVIVESLGSDTSTAVEGKLWEGHIRINSFFRKQLAYLRDVNGKKRPVEHRKKASQYLKFIKTSQRFYRGYIQSLASHPGGLGEIQAVARKLNIDTSLPANTARDPKLHNDILMSCHRTLIHLGDLSRYRTSELDTKKEKDWGPAIGYYDLAIAIYPSSGVSYNQLAIISKAQGDRTRTLYNLYRALSAYEPPATAFNNLDLELKKIREGKTPQTGKGFDDGLESSQSANLQRWFPLLHACYFDSDASGDYETLEGKMLSCLVAGLRERSLKTTAVNRLAVSNIAADFAAGDRWQEYLLEEDDDVIAFRPFQDTHQAFSGSERKARHHGQDLKRHHPNDEMLCRIRDLVEDALELVDNEVSS